MKTANDYLIINDNILDIGEMGNVSLISGALLVGSSEGKEHNTNWSLNIYIKDKD